MKNRYDKTITACFVGYIVQAIVNNFTPLLFLFFQRSYRIPLSQITLLVTFNFGVQLLVDLLSVGFVDKIGYRVSMVMAHVLSAAGLILLTVLPEALPSPFAGILIAVMIYAIGGGLLEVLVSPVVEACPSDNKEKAMSMLHSFYCWGHAGVVLISTVFFGVAGIQNWKILAVIWALIPMGNAFAFAKVPIAPLIEDGEAGLGLKELFRMKVFWILLVMMVCAGASEQAVSQWASTFAEKGLGISKTAGDLAGPMAFAILMGSARLFYGKYGDRIHLERFMVYSCCLCILSYLGVALLPIPQLNLIACAVCGLSVGIMWPGTFSKAAAALPRGGTAMFALLALGGDIGCSGGPTLVGMVSGALGDDLKMGVLAGVVFPVLLLAGIALLGRKRGGIKRQGSSGRMRVAGRIKHMAKNLYRNTGILTVCMAALGLLLTACGASAGGAGENGWEASDTGKAPGGDGIGGEAKSAQPEEEAKEWPGEQDSCKVQELGGYLYGHVSASPYASAEIMIKGYEGEALESDWDAPSAFRFAGEAEVTWRFYSSLAEMETALNEVSRREAEGASLRFLYYTFPMTENVHALDLYHDLKRRFDTEEHPLTVWSMDNGKLLCFLQETLKMEDGYELIYLRHQSSKVNLYVKDRTAYGLTLLDAPSEEDETLEYVFTDIFQSYGSLGSGWGLDEETLYWIDHDERLTELEDPKRSFLEVRGIDENWEYAGDEGVMRYFGLLVEADYELALTEGGRMLSLHFSLSEEEGQEEDSVSDYIYDFRKDAIISAIGSLAESGDGASAEEKETAAKEDAEPRYYLLNGFCMKEPYDMTVTDMETGETLQEQRVSLSIELPDTITYPDLNGDGYADMRVGAPVHQNGAKAEEESFTPPSYLLWDSRTEQFVRKTEKEVENSRRAVANGLTEEEQEEKTKRERRNPFEPVQELPEGAEPEDYIRLTGDKLLEYQAREGDSLWRISERFYGDGCLWATILRAGDAPEDPNYLPVGETVSMPEVSYIRRNPYSRGGLRSEGSFQIEKPDGFAHYFLASDVAYVSWKEENQIHSLPVTNPVGENPFREPKDWEAFQAEAIRCSQELCPGRVSDLTFEKYHMEDGCDLYGYSFAYDTGEEIIEYVDFFKFGKANMAEVIGVRQQEPNTVLVNTVRYMAASFTDYGGRPGMGWGDDAGPNVGADLWEYPYLHNLFEAARKQFENPQF